jgi:plastocyanin
VATATVEVRDNFFTPETVLLLVGGQVTWSWVGQGHTVTSVLSPSFAPNSAVQSAPFTHGPITFPTAGSYRYICSVHGSVSNGQTTGMQGVIIVQ